MGQISLNVQKQFCEECSLALRRFIGNMDGVASIAVEKGRIVISFDEAVITEDRVKTIAQDSAEKLGYTLFDEKE